MAKVTVKQVKSIIGRSKSQKLTIEALELGKINREVQHELTPQISGMIRKVEHLVEVTEG